MKTKVIVAALVCVVAGFTFIGCGSGGSLSQSASTATEAKKPEIVLKLGHGLSETVVLHKAMLSYAQKVLEHSNGRARIDVYANAQLGNERDMVEGMQLGTVDIVYAATAIMANFVSACSIFDAPFLYRDAEHMFKVTDGTIGQAITKQIRDMQGLITLGFMDAGQRHVFSTKPIKTVDDFKGLKIRTMENDLQIALFNALGAQATPMAFGEVYTALQQKTIDAGEQPLQGITGSKFDDICKYVALTGHVYSACVFLLGEKSYNKIPADLREMILEEGKNCCLLQRQLVAAENAKAIDQLKNNGVTISVIDHEALLAKVKSVYTQFVKLLPPDKVAEIAAVK
jgi:tripartite ATP-independent transporter DctP family solute receptor